MLHMIQIPKKHLDNIDNANTKYIKPLHYCNANCRCARCMLILGERVRH